MAAQQLPTRIARNRSLRHKTFVIQIRARLTLTAGTSYKVLAQKSVAAEWPPTQFHVREATALSLPIASAQALVRNLRHRVLVIQTRALKSIHMHGNLVHGRLARKLAATVCKLARSHVNAMMVHTFPRIYATLQLSLHPSKLVRLRIALPQAAKSHRLNM